MELENTRIGSFLSQMPIREMSIPCLHLHNTLDSIGGRGRWARLANANSASKLQKSFQHLLGREARRRSFVPTPTTYLFLRERYTQHLPLDLHTKTPSHQKTLLPHQYSQLLRLELGHLVLDLRKQVTVKEGWLTCSLRCKLTLRPG